MHQNNNNIGMEIEMIFSFFSVLYLPRRKSCDTLRGWAHVPSP